MQHSNRKKYGFCQNMSIPSICTNGNGDTTLCRGRCVGHLGTDGYVSGRCAYSKTRMHDFLPPEGTEKLSHQNMFPWWQFVILCVVLAMKRLESKEGTNITTARLFWWQAQRKTAFLAAALAVSLPSWPTELETRKEAPPFGGVKPDTLVCVNRESEKQEWCLHKKGHNTKDNVR
jgi:hypothetical protein